MSDDGELRERMARADPVRRLDAAGLMPSPTAHEIRERAMQTIEEDMAATEPHGSRWRRTAVVVGAAASAAAIAVAVAVASGGGSGPGTGRESGGSTLALKARPGSEMASCIQFDVAYLREMPVAFSGTVTEVTAEQVTLDVDRWYKGGDVARVTLSTPDGSSVALDGVEFTQGGRYFVSATDGVVNTCGFSGPATAELEQAFDEAFASS